MIFLILDLVISRQITTKTLMWIPQALIVVPLPFVMEACFDPILWSPLYVLFSSLDFLLLSKSNAFSNF